MGFLKRLKTSGSVSLEAFKMYYVMRASAPSRPEQNIHFEFPIIQILYSRDILLLFT